MSVRSLFQEPILGHVEEAYKKQGVERDRTLMALIVKGASPGMFSRMSMPEFNKAQAFLGFFIYSGPEIGEPS